MLGEACSRADAVIVTGGLGPTQDDLTRVAVAQVAGVALQRRQDLADAIAAYFAERGREMPSTNLVQADLPAGAEPLAAVGTAPGFVITIGAATVWCLPGVPREMEVMLDRDVVPALASRALRGTTVSRVVRTSGMSESGVAELLSGLVSELDTTAADAAGRVTIAFLASRGETRVRVTAKAGDRDEALALAEPVVDRIRRVLGSGVTGVDDHGVEWAVAEALKERELTLGLAESVTAGGVASRLVTVPGAGDWLRGSLVTYATETKVLLAGVDPDLLEREGPVSEPVARALAAGARDRLGADVGLAVVGVAGPTPQGGQPVGTCVVAFASVDGSTQAREVRLPGRSRGELQEFAATVALDYLRRRLAEPGWRRAHTAQRNGPPWYCIASQKAAPMLSSTPSAVAYARCRFSTMRSASGRSANSPRSVMLRGLQRGEAVRARLAWPCPRNKTGSSARARPSTAAAPSR